MPSLRMSSADGWPGVGDISSKSPRLPRANGYLVEQCTKCKLIKPPGPAPRKMVKSNPGVSQILSKVSPLRTCNLSFQKTVVTLLRKKEMITRNVTLSKA